MTQLQNVQERLDVQPEMAFAEAGLRQQHVVCNVLPDRISEYLSHYISRHSKDLLVHVQRINFALSREQEAELFGAMLDLYIALGEGGLSLRRKMLKRVSAQLNPEHLAFLSDALESGIDARLVVEHSGISMLTNGFSGSDELVIVERDQANTGDPLQQAMTSVECSNLDEARVILEDALYSDRSNSDQQKLLLEIYRKTDDKKHFMALYETFEGDSNPVQADWLALAEYFELNL